MESVDPSAIIHHMVSSDPKDLIPLPIISIALPILKAFYQIIRTLSENKIIVNKHATIDWNHGILEQEWHIKNDTLKKSIDMINKLTKGLKAIEIPDTLEATGAMIPPESKSLFDLGILTLKNGLLRIDLKRISQYDLSKIVIINFKNSFDKDILYADLCSVDINRVVKYADPHTAEASFSVVLDRADLWLSDFKSLVVKNIKLPVISISVDRDIVEGYLSENLKRKLMTNAHFAMSKSQDALSFFETIQSIFSRLIQDNKDELMDVCNVESSSGRATITNLTCQLTLFEIGEGHQVYLPNGIRVEISCSLSGKDQSLTGKVIFYSDKYKEFIQKLFDEIDSLV
jgi:hypothetical protein